MGGKNSGEVSSHKYIGLIFSNDVRWAKHVQETSTKARKSPERGLGQEVRLSEGGCQMVVVKHC